MTTKLTPQRLTAALPQPDKAYKLSDPATAGLYCLVSPRGTKTFAFSFNLHGKRCEVVIGRFPSVTLTEAREKVVGLRRQVERGEDPRAAKQAAKAEKRAANLPPPPESQFRTFAATWQKEKLIKRAETYKAQIASRLDRFVYPHIGSKALKDITSKDIIALIEPIQIDTPNTAEGVRKIVQAIFDYAVQKQHVDTNPARPLKGMVEVPKSEVARHLSPKELGRMWTVLNRQAGANASTLAAAKLLIYTMTRKNEVLRMKWPELDLDEGLWIVPAERYKTRIPHKVFLSKQAKEILEKQKAVTGHLEYVFPSAFRDNVPLGDATLNHLFKRLDFGVPEFSPHGTRGTAASILGENGERGDVIEKLLGHVKLGTARHYQHQELIEERKKALQWWADFVDASPKLLKRSEAS